jgi:hypothetical protein
VSLQLRISRNTCGTWTVQGLSPEPASNLPSLSASIDYARTACDAAPATIELFVDGMYIVMHQKRGWQRPLFASQGDRTLHGAIRSGPRNISLAGVFSLGCEDQCWAAFPVAHTSNVPPGPRAEFSIGSHASAA